MNKAIITKYNEKLMMAVFSNDILSDLFLYDNKNQNLGNVYLCRVAKKVANIDGCFIQYKHGINGFIKSSSLKPEMIVPLQYKKDGTKSKEPLFTEAIMIKTGLVILINETPSLLISSKINKDKKNDMYNYFSKKDIKYKIILRTNSQYAKFDQIEKEIDSLTDRMDLLLKHSNERPLYTLLYKMDSALIDDIENYRLGYLNEIITDEQSIFNSLIDKKNCEDNILYKNINISLYEDSLLSLYHLYKMNHNIENVTSRNVLLKSGASIVFDQTEALVAIDVNTHYSNIKKDKENTFLSTNIEAAAEIVRQIRIRNLSGIIIIDFINMKNNENYEYLLDYINKIIVDDPCDLKVIGITKLKLFELVRTKKRVPLIEQMR